VTRQQLDMIARIAALDPPVCFMGGYAEDALLAGTVTRPHGDVDLLLLRRDLDLRLEQLSQLRFESLETWGESAPGMPFYLYGKSGDVSLDIGVADLDDGQPYLDVYRLAFEIDGKPAPAGYRVYLPIGTFDHPAVEIDGISMKPADPLALYQLRIGIAGRGSFGELTERQRRSSQLLRERFLSDVPGEQLTPRVEPLDSASDPGPLAPYTL
jgi:hypothetical protein